MPGLFRVNVDALTRFNMIQDVMCASIHTNTVVRKGQGLGSHWAIPLVIDRCSLDNVFGAGKRSISNPFGRCLFNPMKIRLIIIGNEVYNGLIQDRFQKIIAQKTHSTSGEFVRNLHILPDDRERITRQIEIFLEKRLRSLII
ncbi:MAG: molybdopterin-binding protein [Desulfotignum sp.]|nr:molybdopterin-binding protein [Desulfotignum sp.]